MSTQKTAKYPELAASFNDVKSYFIYAGFFSAAVPSDARASYLYAAGIRPRGLQRKLLDTRDAHITDDCPHCSIRWIRMGSLDDLDRSK